MLEQFRQYLIKKGYKEYSANLNPSTCLDYCWRLMTIMKKENITIEQLSSSIDNVIKAYCRSGEKWSIGCRSHESYINALKQFKKFVLVQRFGGING